MNGNNDSDLYREMMANITPITHDTVDNRVQAQSASSSLAVCQPPSYPLSHEDTEHLSLEHANMLKPDEIISYRRDGVQDAVFRKLRLGKYDIHTRLDLHQYTLQDARDEVLAFLKQCQRMDMKTCIIVHGKGQHSSPPALMKSFVCQWLEQISDVQCFHSAQRHHGGTSAVYVLLKKSQEQKQSHRESIF